MTVIQLLVEIPGICYNKECPDYKSFELYDASEIKSDDRGDYFICYKCKKKIYIDENPPCENCGKPLPNGKRKYCISARHSCPSSPRDWEIARHNIESKKRDKPKKRNDKRMS